MKESEDKHRRWGERKKKRKPGIICKEESKLTRGGEAGFEEVVKGES